MSNPNQYAFLHFYLTSLRGQPKIRTCFFQRVVVPINPVPEARCWKCPPVIPSPSDTRSCRFRFVFAARRKETRPLLSTTKEPRLVSNTAYGPCRLEIMPSSNCLAVNCNARHPWSPCAEYRLPIFSVGWNSYNCSTILYNRERLKHVWTPRTHCPREHNSTTVV